MKAAIMLLHVGGGHMEAATNVKKQLETQHEGIEVRIIDGLQHTFPLFGPFFRWWWQTVQNKAPGVWGWMYESPFFSSKFFAYFMYSFPWYGMRRILKEWQPDMVFTTHYVCTPVALEARRKHNLKFKMNYIITEYIWHDSYFWWPEVDRYYISAPVQKDALDKRGYDPKQITLSGIPIKPVFADAMTKEEARDQLKIPKDATVLFFFAGTFGGTAIDRLIAEMDDLEVYPVVVCGRNDEVKAQIEGLLKTKKMDGTVYGFVDFMNVIMRACDLMVGKGGALMCAECLATGTPVLLFGSPPGHELGNAEFVQDLGAGILTPEIEDVIKNVKELLANPEKLARMKEVGLAAGNAASAGTVASAALSDVRKQVGA